MDVKQIYSTLNDYISQREGLSAVAVTDFTSFYSLGETITGDTLETDNFGNWLVDRIGRTNIRTLDVDLDFPGFIRNEYEFGAMIQKVDVQPFTAQAQEAWNVGKEGFTPTNFKIDKPTVKVSYVKGAAAWEVDVTIPDTMLKTAFTSESAMSAFITAIFDAMRSSITIQLNAVSHGALCGLIAEKAEAENGIVNVLDLYNTAYGLTGDNELDAATALEAPPVDFLKFAGKVMRDYISWMKEPSALFNVDGMVRATPRDNMHVLINTSLASAYSTYLQSGTFNEEYTSLPYYQEVRWWMGTGTTAPNSEDNTKVYATTKSGATVECDYVIGAFIDREAIAVGLFDRFTATDRNNRNRYTNYTEGCTIQHAVFLDESSVIFVLADPVVTPAETGEVVVGD